MPSGLLPACKSGSPTVRVTPGSLATPSNCEIAVDSIQFLLLVIMLRFKNTLLFSMRPKNAQKSRDNHATAKKQSDAVVS
jgi:hypothetical protein